MVRISKSLSKTILQYYYSINNSKILLGLAILVTNLFSKYIVLNISKGHQEYIKNAIGREILIFIMVFVGTRDLITSFLLTAAFLILSNTVFNEKSKLCIIPAKYKELEDEIDTNHDGYISEKEIEHARNILHKANQNKNKNKFIN
jgi:hypothetical protein